MFLDSEVALHWPNCTCVIHLRGFNVRRCPSRLRAVPVMRLIDQVIGSKPEVVAVDRFGRTHRLVGVAAKADLLRDCPLRFVLDPAASVQCFALVRSDTGLLDPGNELLRLPARRFWLEWVREESEGVACSAKLGALVDADETGRRGSVTGYWQNSGGDADLTVVSAEFDLDQPMGSDSLGGTTWVRHGTLPHLDPLLRHVRFRLDPSWEPYMRAQRGSGYREAIQELAEAAWFNFPVALAFSAMLNSNGLLKQRPSDLSRLNDARTRRGRVRLLDHIEVRLNLDAIGQGQASDMGGSRAASRLHHVRGHLVRRSGKTFWRSSHLRGDTNRPIASKTITIVGGGPLLRPENALGSIYARRA